MKKVLALALALCMMLAMGTVAFAYGETINKRIRFPSPAARW